MDKFALYRFPEESLSAESVNRIQNFDPIGKHNSKTWPTYTGPTQKNNWVKVNWPNEDKNKRATGTTKLLAAQVVKFSPVRSDLDIILDRMLLRNETEDHGAAKSPVKKSGKRKAATIEDRILQRIRLVLAQEATPAPHAQGPSSVVADLPGTETEAVAAKAATKEAEARAAKAEARAAEADMTVMAATKVANAEAKVTEAKVEVAEAKTKVAEAEAKAVAAEARVLFVVDTLWPLLEGMPGLLGAMQSRLEAAPAVVNAGAPEEEGPPMRFGAIILVAHRLRRLSSSPSIYAQELAAIVFGNDTLDNGSLRGSQAGGGKEVLCKDVVSDIIAHVVAKFPGQTESSVRAYLRRKCNNASSALKKNGGGSQARLLEDACD